MPSKVLHKGIGEPPLLGFLGPEFVEGFGEVFEWF